MSLTKQQAAIAAAAMKTRVQALADLLKVQVQTLPEGCSDWTKTSDQLRQEHETLIALQNIEATS
jgi:hypothetical protein